MKQFLTEKKIHLFFVAGIALKALNAALEIIGGFLIFTISQKSIVKIVLFLTQEELSEDPKDVIANYLINSAEHFSLSAKHFIAFYLLSHGILKLGVIIGLFKSKLWSYPASMAVFGIFIIYQVYRYFHTYSFWLLALTIFDLVVVWLIWHEYKNVKNITKIVTQT
jgi:uncharacterized membrane protein